MAVPAYLLGQIICEALGIDAKNVKRLVLDIDASSDPVKVYVELFGSDNLLKLDWAGKLHDTEIKFMNSTGQDEAKR